ncbi:LytTR family transcriptional regulator [Olivibacter jilunii]
MPVQCHVLQHSQPAAATTLEGSVFEERWGLQHFDPALFLRIHRSVIINLAHVRELYKDIHRTFIVLDNGVELSVGRNYLPNVKSLII